MKLRERRHSIMNSQTNIDKLSKIKDMKRIRVGDSEKGTIRHFHNQLFIPIKRKLSVFCLYHI